MSFVGDFWAAKEAISLLADLKTLLDMEPQAQNASLRQTLLQLRAGAVGSADRLSAKLNEIMVELNGLRINLDQPEQNAGNQFRYFLEFPQRMKFKRLTEELHLIKEQVRVFADDVEQLLMCAGVKKDDLETTAYRVRERLNALSTQNAPLREHLTTMMTVVGEIGQSLRA